MSEIKKIAKKMTDLIRQGTKLAHENEALHKTSQILAEEARRIERLMNRKRWTRN